MKANLGNSDKIIRVLLALIIGLLVYFRVVSGTWAIVLGVFAIIMVITSLISFCGLYALFGINTCRKK